MKIEHKPYPMNMHKPQREMRAKRIKDKFIKSGLFKDNGQFDCGDHIAYEMEKDFNTMQLVIHLLRDCMRDFLNDDDVQVETMTGRDMVLLTCITELKNRINVPDMDDERRYESTQK